MDVILFCVAKTDVTHPTVLPSLTWNGGVCFQLASCSESTQSSLAVWEVNTEICDYFAFFCFWLKLMLFVVVVVCLFSFLFCHTGGFQELLLARSGDHLGCWDWAGSISESSAAGQMLYGCDITRATSSMFLSRILSLELCFCLSMIFNFQGNVLFVYSLCSIPISSLESCSEVFKSSTAPCSTEDKSPRDSS